MVRSYRSRHIFPREEDYGFGTCNLRPLLLSHDSGRGGLFPDPMTRSPLVGVSPGHFKAKLSTSFVYSWGFRKCRKNLEEIVTEQSLETQISDKNSESIHF